MRCPSCGIDLEGVDLEEGKDICPRCGQDYSIDRRRHRTIVSVVFVGISLVVIALLVYVVLLWHELQMPLD